MSIDLDELREEYGFRPLEIGLRLRELTAGNVWTIRERGGLMPPPMGSFEHEVNGVCVSSGFSYVIKSQDGTTCEIKAALIEDNRVRQFEVLS